MINDIRFRSDVEMLVLQVSYYNENVSFPTDEVEKWRDAVVEDLLEVAEILQKKYQREILPQQVGALRGPERHQL